MNLATSELIKVSPFDHKIPIVSPVLPAYEELEEAVKGIVSSGMVTKGTWLQAFEEAVAHHLGVKHAIAVSSCTSGLMLTYRGLGLSGEVVVPSFTFMATVSAMIWAGLQPVFADVDFGTTNLDPAAAEAAITPRTSAIVAVHNFGNPADIAALQDVANRHRLKLIFDAAHGFGALYEGVPVGRQGDAQVYSLSPTKLLIAGEGGIVATNDDNLAQNIRIGREYGNNGHYDSLFAGLNARLAEFNALLGLHSLKRLEEAVIHRNKAVAIYKEELAGVPGLQFQEVRSADRCSYKDLSVVIDPAEFGMNRDELALALAAANVDTRKYYEPPVHLQTAYKQYITDLPLPNTLKLSAQSLSLPIWSHISVELVREICGVIRYIREVNL